MTVAACDWSVMRPIYEAKRRRRFLDRVAPAQTAVQNRLSETEESFWIDSAERPRPSAGNFYAIASRKKM